MSRIRNEEEFADTVEQMRDSQKAYRKTQNSVILMRCKKLEAEVDLYLAERKGVLTLGVQPGLFGGRP
jgi:hypothetical protein